MRRTRRILILILAALIVSAGPASLQAADGWSMSKLWPFGGTNQSKSKGMGMPKMDLNPLDWTGLSHKSKKKKPSPVTRLTSSTKNAWNKTWDASKSLLTFGADSKPKQKRPVSSQKPLVPKTSLGGLFGAREVQRPRTTGEFLRQERVGSTFR